MNSPDPSKLEEQLNQLEAEINIHPVVKYQPEEKPSSPLPLPFAKLIDWYQDLSGSGKIIAVVVSAIVGFMALGLFLRLVATLLSLAVLGTLLYIGYKFFSKSQPSSEKVESDKF